MDFDFTGLYDIHNKPIRNGDIVRRMDKSGTIIGEGEVKHGVYECSYCDEYRCDHYGWYIDFAINDGYIKTNTGYPLFIGHDMKGEKNEIIGKACDNLDVLDIK